MHRVLTHIDRHLDQPLELNELAEVAHFSPYHFHRLFAAWMGERLGDYLRRRRLEVAALRLETQPRTPVLEVALGVGFGSAEAFARAFKLRFGSSPSAWRAQQVSQRRNSNPDQVNRKIDQASTTPSDDHRVFRNPHQAETMNVKITDWQPVPVAYLRHLGPYGESLGVFWMNTVYPWMATNQLLGRARFGISHDDPSVTAPAQCRYDAAVAVAPDFTPTGGALKTVIPGGKYATLSFKGGSEQIGAAWDALLRDWLPSSGMQLDARPSFEHYPVGSTYDAQTGEFSCEICIPVVPL